MIQKLNNGTILSCLFGGKRRWVLMTEFVYFDISKIVLRNLGQFRNITSGIYAKYHVQIMLLFVYTTTRKVL